MAKLTEGVNALDYHQMKSAAHIIKGSSGYIGASRLHYACYFIQENFMKENRKEMLAYYPTVVEAVVEFKVYSR